MKKNCFKNISFLIVLFISFKNTNLIKIPIKLVKSTFNKIIPQKKHLIHNNQSSYMISQNIIDLADYLFAIDIKIGSNGQTFTMLIDTGSEIVWVPSKNTDFSSRYYVPSSSTTSRRTSDSFNYGYSAGTVSGYYYYDQINFMSRNFYFTFGMAERTNLERAGFDGVLGLGRKYFLQTKKYSILETFKTNGAVTSTVFSFKYDYSTKDLTFYIGEQHEDFKKKNAASCPLIESDTYETKLWLCDLYSFGIKKGDEIIKRISIDYEGLFDTGTNNIMLPLELLNDLESTFNSFNCYIYEEGDRSESVKAVYCRDGNNLPKITIGLKSYILTIGKENFYTRLYSGNSIIYRLRLLFVQRLELCIIGQNFFYEYHTLFDDKNSYLKFYNDDEGNIQIHEEKTRIKLWVLLTIIIGSILIVGFITFIIVYCLCCRKKEYSMLEGQFLEMSSIQKIEDTNEDTAKSSNFNQIMNITTKSNSKSRFNKKQKKNQNNN